MTSRIASGLELRLGAPVVYRHRVDVLGRRTGALWPSREHASMRIVSTVVYDSLTQRYELLRTIRHHVLFLFPARIDVSAERRLEP